MAYMSYCRFEGTHDELKTCLLDVDEHIDGEAEEAVSFREVVHFRNMIEEFWSWLCDRDLIDENGELREDEIESICEQMQKGAEQ